MNSVLYLSEKEAYQMAQEKYPDTFFSELKQYVRVLKAIQTLRNFSLGKSLTYALKMNTNRREKICFLASYHILKKSNKMSIELDRIDYEISNLKRQSEFIVNGTQTPLSKTIGLEAISKETEALNFKKQQILAGLCVDPDAEIEATLIRPNGSEQHL